MACETEAADFILESSSNICSNVMLEMKKSSIKLKLESVLCLYNLIQYCSKPESVQNLIRKNLLGILNDELHDGTENCAL